MSVVTRTLSGRLAVQLCVAVLATAALFGTVYHVALNQAAVDEAVRQQRQRQDAIAAGLTRVFADLEARAGALAWQINQGTLDAVQLDMQLRAHVLHDPDISAMAVFLESENPVAPGSRVALSAAYDGAGITVRDFLATGYEFADRDWYRRTLASPSGYWSDIFFNDAAGGLDTLNYDLPLDDAAGQRVGMLGVSVSLDRIGFVARELGLSGEHRFLLTDGAGRVLVSSEPTLERAYTLNEALQRAPQQLAWMAGGRLGGVARDERYDAEDEQGWRSYTPLRPPGWHLLSAVPDSVAWSERRAVARRVMFWGAGISVAMAGLGLVGLHARLRPVRRLLASTARIVSDDEPRTWRQRYPDLELQRAADQLRAGAEVLRQTRTALQAEQDANESLCERNALFARMHRLQQPDDRTFFGSRFECAWQARLTPADPIEGVFYGFLSTRPDSCHFFLGAPVDGEVPALVSLGQICGSLPRLLRTCPEPAHAMSELSEWVALERPQSMQFRLLLGRLDLATGEVEYVCADAGGPLVLRADGAVDVHRETVDSEPLRRDQDIVRATQTLMLRAGDRLLLTSGLVDPTSAGIESMRMALESWSSRPDEELLDGLLARDTGPFGVPRERCVVMARLRHRD